MACNVFRFTTFGAGNRALRSNDPCPKCAGAKHHKGPKPDWCFAEAEPPKGAKRKPFVICSVAVHHYLQ